jgi:hypothetical protein
MSEIDEAELMSAWRAGAAFEGAVDGVRRVVQAGVLRRCCHELKDHVDPRGLRLGNAVVAGCLDLAGLVVPFPVRFDGCDFDCAPMVEGAELVELSLTGSSRLPGLLGNGLRLRRDLDMSRSRVTGTHWTSASTSRRSAIWLCDAQIGGRLKCRDATIDGLGDQAIRADRMQVGSDVGLSRRFCARGAVRLLGVGIGGSVDLTGAQIESSDGPAIDLAEAVIKGNVFLIDDPDGRRPAVRGRVDLGGARIAGRLVIRDADIDARAEVPDGSIYPRFAAPGTALGADRLLVGGEVVLAGHCEVGGAIDLSMSNLTSVSIGEHCVLRAPGRAALDLTSAQIRAFVRLDHDAVVEGAILMTGATVQAARSAWLARQATFDSGAYEQAARVFRQHGYTSQAEQILITQRRHASQVNRPGTAWPRRTLDAAYATIGYGYRPSRVLWLLAALLILVTATLEIPASQATLRATNGNGDVYATSGLIATSAGPVTAGPAARRSSPRADSCGNGEVRCFSPVLYAIDTVIPLISLDQRSTWYPNPHASGGQFVLWWLSLATLLGWLLSSIFALSLARIARNP